MYKFFTLALLSIPLLSMRGFAALDDTQIVDREKTADTDISLRSFTSCEAMESVLTKYFKEALLNQINMYGAPGKPIPVEEGAANVPAPARDGIGGGGGDGGFSKTNVQIADIDEAEVVKTDGKYIYYTSNQPDADGFQYVTITRAVPVNDMTLVKRIKLPRNYGNVQLYVADGRLTILANRWREGYVYSPSPINVGNGSVTVVVVYDIDDPANPVLNRFYTVNGDLSQSRRDGDYLYVLSQNYVSFNTW